MAFRAVHERWGPVFAHLPDLGCGQAWGEVWRARPAAPLFCDECRHRMHAKVSRTGLRFFAHSPGAPQCSLAAETLAHHLLKLELASAAREAGAHAELEVRGPDGAWRADVMASDPAGAWRMALEAQLSPITEDEIAARTERMQAGAAPPVWFTEQRRLLWFGRVPWARVEAVSGRLVVVEGLAKFSGQGWEEGPRVPLAGFLHWLFTGQLVLHRPQAAVRPPVRARLLIWTTPRHVQAESQHLAQVERRAREREVEERRIRAEMEKLRAAQREQDRVELEGRARHRAAIKALEERRAALEKPVADFILRHTGEEAYIEARGVPEFAMGVPVCLGNRRVAVLCPVAGRVAAVREDLKRLVVFVASERERQRIAEHSLPGQKIIVLDAGLEAAPVQGPPAGQEALPFEGMPEPGP
ncbi:competence protein CoiA family protein [Streptomyces xiamenensis]|uniref:competence protein CoiA family protein n=1 Tax=Streptomyces xiamenensis TaxID=408015 RepID=UPI0035E360D4